jgi:hypothetical protein
VTRENLHTQAINLVGNRATAIDGISFSQLAHQQNQVGRGAALGLIGRSLIEPCASALPRGLAN